MPLIDLDQIVLQALQSDQEIRDGNGQLVAVFVSAERFHKLTGTKPAPAPKPRPTRKQRKDRQRARLAAEAAEKRRKKAGRGLISTAPYARTLRSVYR